MTAGAVLSALSRVAATQKTDNKSRQEMTVPNAAAAASEQTAAADSRSLSAVCGQPRGRDYDRPDRPGEENV